MATELGESRAMRGLGPAQVDRIIASLAAAQHGVVTAQQLIAHGVGQDSIDRRVRAGRLHRLYRGVFAVGHTSITEEGTLLAAVFAAGTGAVSGSIAALALWGIRERRPSQPVCVTVARDVRIPGVRVRRVDELPVADTSMRKGVPVLMPGPALLEAASSLGERELRRAVGQALVMKLVSVPGLVELLARNRGRRGVKRLARVLASAKPTRSELEEATVAFLDAYGFPRFETNAKVHGDEVDVLWRDLGLVVEADGGAFHDNPIARANDAAKQARLEARGLRVERVRWRDVTSGQAATAAELRAVIAEMGESRE